MYIKEVSSTTRRKSIRNRPARGGFSLYSLNTILRHTSELVVFGPILGVVPRRLPQHDLNKPDEARSFIQRLSIGEIHAVMLAI